MNKNKAPEGTHQREYRVSSLERALALLDIFSASEAALSGSELAERLDTRAGTIYPTLRTLQRYGYLERDEQKRYRLGLKFLEKGRIILNQLDVRNIAEPHLTRLAKDCKANAHLAVLYEGHVMYLHREEGYPSITIRDIVGSSVPAHCTALGKVLLAHLDDSVLDSFLCTQELQPLTPNTITDRELLRDKLRKIKQRGYAIDNEEFHEGVVCVAAPVRDYRGRVSSAISISLPRSRFADPDEREHLIQQVTATAVLISRDQGFEDLGDDNQTLK